MAAKKARDVIRSKTLLDGAGMPDKLKDCTSKNRDERELFIVEGDSAGGSAVMGRDPSTQAILPIRGKILNVERARLDKMLKNLEIQALISAIGAGVGEEFDVEKLRYDKVIAMCDADVDGQHIRTLLLTFFFRQMKHAGRARPRVHRAAAAVLHRGGQGEGLPEGRRTPRPCSCAENPNHRKDFQRLKGLGEMDWEELQDDHHGPEPQRTLLQVTVEQAALADDVISTLMGDDVEERKQFIITNANDVRFLDI